MEENHGERFVAFTDTNVYVMECCFCNVLRKKYNGKKYVKFI